MPAVNTKYFLLCTFVSAFCQGNEKLMIQKYLEEQLCSEYMNSDECTCLDPVASEIVGEALLVPLQKCLPKFIGYCTDKKSACLNVGPNRLDSDSSGKIVVGGRVCVYRSWPPKVLGECQNISY